ncbi:MAG TPA: bifunctional [glutamate--ammonia ligase]-adenylyl-L-tyrosine phosphorylase/[glutamate--ammonia-ligase] adenylyltransferase, partial [Usitatibacteraceae bacterium]|nr:bifunctional [glutamate--ammonia ligase]-adenylyl-L-tyrosine phosphorylase/[glutamate--ammonia-ligase] adenylyltransferase [Usitatibacteraceae bacterium]
MTPPFSTILEAARAASHFAERALTAYPELIGWLEKSSAAPLPAEFFSFAAAGDADEADFDRDLRLRRRQWFLHTLLRDVGGLASFDQTLAAITAFAEAAVRAATGFHRARLMQAWGLDSAATGALSELVVVGMGKLGGGELNVSSDIDLIFVHAEDGSANATRSWHEFHSELGKRIIRSLDTIDANGFVFRVDMRLRPFGASGPLVGSLASLENYFITQARAWERYAWLKGRALTGSAANIGALEALVKPFVYRRYHDYAAIDEMRELHRQIRAEAERRNRLDDIKVGPGGIREVEFVAQLAQLIRGGREPALQTRSTREALALLPKLGIIDAPRAAELAGAYRYLRDLEHRLQYLDDQQTQALPTGEADRQRVARAMGHTSWEELLPALARHRGVVSREFNALFASPAKEGAGRVADDPLETRIGQLAAASGLDDDAQAAVRGRVESWLRASRTASLSPRVRGRIEGLLPAMLSAAAADSGAEATFFRLFDLVDAIDRREAYLALLAEYPAVLQRLARIANKSAWAADYVRRHPILLDELLDARLAAPIDWAAERQRLREACDRTDGDVEQQYEILRHTKQSLTFRLNVADIDGRIGIMALSDELTLLADLLVDTTLVLAARAIGLHAGAPDWTPVPGLAVIGYGKLGSKELGYASDLDLVFVAADEADGQALTRLVQRVLSWLNSMTAGGVLYDTDLRLR